MSSFLSDIGVATLAGLLGLAETSQDGIDFRGIFHHPYEPFSSSAHYKHVLEVSLFMTLANGIIASPPSVSFFGEKKPTHVREASSGHNCFALYVNKLLSTLLRMILSDWHFTTLCMYLSTPRMT